MATRGTTIAQGFSNKVMRFVYDRNLIDSIVNRDYQGEINAVGSKLNIMDFDKVTEKTYANAAMTADALSENSGALVISEYRAFYWKEKVLENWLSYIKDPHPSIVEQVANERSKNMDEYVLGLYGDIGAGNRVGTSVTAGTVGVDNDGVVTGTNSVFTAGMVGRGFKADGHSTWYRVKTYSGVNTITIEDDSDDETSAYSGGVIAGSSTYEIEAATALTLTPANISGYVGDLKLKLDLAEANGYTAVPAEGRFLIVPPEFEDTLTNNATGVSLHVPEAYTDQVKKGMITQFKGFNIYVSNRLTGDNTDGYHIIAGHSGWMTFAEKVLQARMEEDLPGDFGTAYKDLFVYGAKVKDARRHMAAELFAKFS